MVLSSTSNVRHTYPVASVQTAFRARYHGHPYDGDHYGALHRQERTLIAMSSVTTATGPVTIQTWSITADGTIAGVRNATEEVTGIIERQVIYRRWRTQDMGPLQPAPIARASGSPELSLQEATTQPQQRMSGGNVVTQNYGGDIGSNGSVNLTVP